MFVGQVTLFSANALECVFINNQECKIKPQILSIKSDNLFFLPYNIQVKKYSGGCNNVNDPFAKLCVADVVKNINVKVFNLM